MASFTGFIEASRDFWRPGRAKKPKFFFTDERRKLMYPDLIDMSAPAHAFAIRNDMDVRQYIHNQFEKRAANVISQYHK